MSDEAGAPVPGVVVMLIDARATTITQALSDQRGEFRLPMVPAGQYRLRTLRIGFRPVSSDAFELRSGADVDQHLILRGVAFALDTMRVVEQGTCHDAGDSTQTLYALWEQVRGALAATQMSVDALPATVTTLGYERTFDRDLQRLRDQQVSLTTARVAQPWQTLPSDSLRNVGFVVTASDSTTYYAPGLDALLAPTFVGDYCLRFAAPSDPQRIGIDFEPATVRRGVSDIRGTLWIDRHSTELRSLEFRYVNIPAEQERVAGGRVEFARLANGLWTVWSWSIRMPILGKRRPADTRVRTLETYVAQVHVEGGELATVTRGDTLLWSHPAQRMVGSVSDSSSGAPIPFARVAIVGQGDDAITDAAGHFTIAALRPGSYSADVHTPHLDSIGVVTRVAFIYLDSASPVHLHPVSDAQVRTTLATRRSAVSSATLSGRVVTEGTSRPIAGAEITVSDPVLRTRSDSTGAFRINGVGPGSHTLSVRLIGYGPLDAQLVFTSGATVDRTVYLTKGVVLDSVHVLAERVKIREFDDDRRIGLGHFITRDDLEKTPGRTIGAIFAALPGAVVMGSGTHAFISTSRGATSLSGTNVRRPQPDEVALGARPGCYAHVCVDGIRVFGAQSDPLFDLASIPQDHIEAIEYFAGPSQTPARYSSLDATCGVVVVWTKRDP
ncbi:MAG: carboxypeptidase regulatory-like domain-containing protein [bacterium]